MEQNYSSVESGIRCGWAKNQRLAEYHDAEWGVPVHEDGKLFEFMVLDAFQAGLSWDIVLAKREEFRKALDGFNPEKIARYDDAKVDELRGNAGIIRNLQKIKSTIKNSRMFLEVQEEYGGFDPYIWKFVNGTTIVNSWRSDSEIPAVSRESDAMSKDLKSRGFSFVGSTICYAFMQAAGMVNDHITGCFRYREIIDAYSQEPPA